MPERLDPRPLVGGLIRGLRRREEGAGLGEKRDAKTIVALLGVPLFAALLVILFQIELAHADQLVAGASLFTAALLTAFVQVATWRERLLKGMADDNGSQIRALNEAAAHVLASLLVALGSVALVIAIMNLDTIHSPSWAPKLGAFLHWSDGGRHWAGVILSALATAAFAYLAVTLLIVVNLLWDAYGYEQEGVKKGQAEDLKEP